MQPCGIHQHLKKRPYQPCTWSDVFFTQSWLPTNVPLDQNCEPINWEDVLLTQVLQYDELGTLSSPSLLQHLISSALRILHPLILILHCKVNVIWWVDSKTSPCSTFQCPFVAFKDQCLFVGSRIPEFSPLTVDLLDHLNNITFSSFTKTRNPISHLLPQ